MKEPTVITPSDGCPACGGEFRRHRAASSSEWAAFMDRENPRPLPPRVDSMDPARIPDHGTLHRCPDCGYQLRAPDPAPAPVAALATEA